MDTLELMKHASEIRKYLFNLTTYIPRNESPNPYYGRTEEGLVLIQYYGCPGSIGTPIGKWAVDGGGCDYKRNWFEIAKPVLDLVEIQPIIINDMGEFGPIHAITKSLDGTILPSPKHKFEFNGLSFISCINCIDDSLSCSELFEKYYSQWKEIELQLGDWKLENKSI